MFATIQRSLLLLTLVGVSALTACGHKDDKAPPVEPTARVLQEFDDEVTADNYLSGKAFCQEYSEDTKLEHPMIVKVPQDYTNPTGPTLDVYAWTMRPFDPKLPSVIMIDGGPGQNSHGFGESLEADWNEIHFDQRGLGCSAPETFEQYRDQKYFSTGNTVRDMDEIRKAYQIEKWSVFGVSYGTVPATQYASMFSDKTVAISLEGTVNSVEDIHSGDWKIEKWNTVLSRLNEAQQKGFGEMITQEKYQSLIYTLFRGYEYKAEGFRKILDLLKVLIDEKGKVNYEVLDNSIESSRKSREESKTKDKHSKYAQTPMGIDIQIYKVIFCKDLGYESLKSQYGFDSTTLRFKTMEEGGAAAACDKVGVPASDRKVYQASKFPVIAPVTYFQGSHDGATLARGAFKHLFSVPQGKFNFILNKKGGHNPLSQAVFANGGGTRDLVEVHRKLFAKSLKGEVISKEDITKANATRDGNKYNPGLWLLIDKTEAGIANMKSEMDGIQRSTKATEYAL
jgi:proline iminopeptidase